MKSLINEISFIDNYIIVRLSEDLTKEFGKGYSKRNIELIRKFCLSYRNAKSLIS